MRSLRSVVVAAVAAVALVLTGGPLPASAHGGDIVLNMLQDGIGGIQIIATYAEDGHPVDAILDPVLTATSLETGESIEPVSLISSNEGEGIWLTPEPVLPAGMWSIKVAVTTPVEAEVIEDMDIVVVDQGSLDPGNGPLVPLLVGAGVAVLIAIALIAVFFVLRRRAARS